MWYVSVCCIKQISSVFGYVVHLKEHLTIVFYHTTIYLENDILLTSLISYSVCEDKMSYENLTHYVTCQNTHSLSLLRCSQQLTEMHIRSYTKQLLEGVNFLHTNKILHRDIKGI